MEVQGLIGAWRPPPDLLGSLRVLLILGLVRAFHPLPLRWGLVPWFWHLAMQTVFWSESDLVLSLNSSVDGQGCPPGQVDSARWGGRLELPGRRAGGVAMGVPGFHLFCTSVM